jgi:peptide/nickel transport system permease protein
MPRSIPASGSAELAPVASPEALGGAGPLALTSIFASLTARIGLVLTGITVATAIFGPLLTHVDPFAITGGSLVSPSMAHPMGTDALGRDLFSGVLYGARTSLIIAIAVGALAFVCGVVIGIVAGYRGGWVDDVLMRLTELFQVIPRFFLVVITVALFGPGLDRLVLTLGLTSWPVLARVVRGEVLAIRDLDFVAAAEATGATPVRVVWRELLPNVMPSVLVLTGLMFGQTLLLEASVGFLGLGDPNAMSWGMLAGQAQSFLRVAWWLALFPGIAITTAVLGTNLVADALASALRGR